MFYSRFESWYPSVITSSGVTWGGVFAKSTFADKFKIVDKKYTPELSLYEVTVVFYADKTKDYTFSVSQGAYNGSKEVLAVEILRQLKNE